MPNTWRVLYRETSSIRCYVERTEHAHEEQSERPHSSLQLCVPIVAKARAAFEHCVKTVGLTETDSLPYRMAEGGRQSCDQPSSKGARPLVPLTVSAHCPASSHMYQDNAMSYL